MKKCIGLEALKYWFHVPRGWTEMSALTHGHRAQNKYSTYCNPKPVGSCGKISPPESNLQHQLKKSGSILFFKAVMQDKKKENLHIHSNNCSLIAHRLQWKFRFAPSPRWGQAAEGSHKNRGIFQWWRAGVLLAKTGYDFLCFQNLHLVFHKKNSQKPMVGSWK